MNFIRQQKTSLIPLFMVGLVCVFTGHLIGGMIGVVPMLLVFLLVEWETLPSDESSFSLKYINHAIRIGFVFILLFFLSFLLLTSFKNNEAALTSFVCLIIALLFNAAVRDLKARRLSMPSVS